MDRLQHVLAAGLTVIALVTVMTGCAAIRPSDHIRAKVIDVSAVDHQTNVELAYGMNRNIKEGFCQGAILPVYDMGRSTWGEIYASKFEEGKIKIVGNGKNDRVQAVLVEGRVRGGDMVMQSKTDCMTRAQ